MSYLDLSIKEIHCALKEKKVSIYELVKESLLRAENTEKNVFEFLMSHCDLENIKINGDEIDNVLFGIPYAIKDNISTKDIPTTGSSNMLNGYVPVFNATCVDNLTSKGCISIGKTTLDELGMGGTGTTGHLGICLNPWDKSKTRIIGGSSCGSTYAVASGIVPFALATDTGDSIRKPASYGGVVGFKPTWSRVSRYGLFSFAPSFDTIGVMARCVEDCAIVSSAMSGRDLKDSTSSNREAEVFERLLGKDVSHYKIAVIKEIVDAISDKEIVSKFNETIKELQKNGVQVDFISMDKKILESLFPTYFVITCAEATSNNANLDGIKFGPFFNGSSYSEVMKNARTNGFSELIKRRFIFGSFALMKENQEELFLKAQRNRRLIVNTVNAILKEYDFLYAPAAASVAPTIDNSEEKLNDEYLIANNHLCIANFAGLPSITLPIGFKEGLPYGANLTGRAFEDAKVIQIAEKLEQITGYKMLSTRTGEKL